MISGEIIISSEVSARAVSEVTCTRDNKEATTKYISILLDTYKAELFKKS